MIEVQKKIQERGWYQGALLEVEDKQIKPVNGKDYIESGLYFLLNQDCDIVTPSIEIEPYIEVIRFRPLIKQVPDGNYTYGKNPRRIQVPLQRGNEEIFFECFAKDKTTLNRELLVSQNPYIYKVSRAVIKNIISWVIKRYDRAAFPDNFNKRLRRDKLREILKGSENIAAVYIALHTQEELSDNKPYEIELVLLLDVKRNELVSEKEERLSDILEEMVNEIVKNNQIEIPHYSIKCRNEVKLSEFDSFLEIDFDDLSFRNLT